MRIDLAITTLAAAALGAQGRTSPHRRAPAEHLALRAQPQGTLQAVYGGGRCIDVKDALLANGQPLQIWQCFGGANQQWQWAGGKLRTGLNQCLDVPDGRRANGVRLQTWACTPGNTNQAFEQVGQSLRWVGSGMCVDILDGRMRDGTALQLWDCDAGNPNQAFSMATSAATTPASARPAPTSPAASTTLLAHAQASSASASDDEGEISPILGSYLGNGYIDFDDFVACHPELTEWAAAILDAATATSLPPILLGAIVLEMSDGHAEVLPGGLTGLSDTSVWATYGQGGKVTVPQDNLRTAGRYLAALLQAKQFNLNQALATYSKNRPGFTAAIANWMGGAA